MIMTSFLCIHETYNKYIKHSFFRNACTDHGVPVSDVFDNMEL